MVCSILFASTHANAEASVWVAEIRGTINPGSSNFLKSTIRRAERDNAQALILELDTPGGLVSSVREMAQEIDQSEVPVVVFVSPAGASATSAGALLMLASHVAAMAPGTNIGAAHPVGPQGEEIKGAAGQKAVNDVAAFARGLADLKGRNKELAEEIVSRSKSVTAKEALDQRLIEIVADTREALIQKLHGRSVRLRSKEITMRTQGAPIKTSRMTAGQSLLHYLANPNIAGLLMTLAVLLIYVELSAPGISIAGILGGIALLVAFMSFQLIPIRTGGVLLILLGIVMLVLEPFVPTHGTVALGGIISFVLGLVWIVDPSSSSLTISPYIWVSAAIILGLLVALIGLAASRMKHLTQRALSKIGGGSMAGLAGYRGHVESVLPGGTRGKAVFRGELWDFESTEPLQVGDSVKAVKVENFVLYVKKDL